MLVLNARVHSMHVIDLMTEDAFTSGAETSAQRRNAFSLSPRVSECKIPL